MLRLCSSDAAAEKYTERNIAHHSLFDGFAEQLDDAPGAVFLIVHILAVDRLKDIPVFPFVDRTVQRYF